MALIDLLINCFGLFGTILGIVSSILAYYTFISPITRLKHYLKDTKGWKKSYLARGRSGGWQYEKHPEFVITEGDDIIPNFNAKEVWMKSYSSPLKSSYLVTVKVNGQVMISKEFIRMDNGKISMPLPVLKENVDNVNLPSDYYITELQADIGRIISIHDNYKSFDDLINEHTIKIINQNTNMKKINKKWYALAAVFILFLVFFYINSKYSINIGLKENKVAELPVCNFTIYDIKEYTGKYGEYSELYGEPASYIIYEGLIKNNSNREEHLKALIGKVYNEKDILITEGYEEVGDILKPGKSVPFKLKTIIETRHDTVLRKYFTESKAFNSDIYPWFTTCK